VSGCRCSKLARLLRLSQPIDTASTSGRLHVGGRALSALITADRARLNTPHFSRFVVQTLGPIILDLVNCPNERHNCADIKYLFALEAPEGNKKISQISSENEIHSNLSPSRIRHLSKDGPKIFRYHERLYESPDLCTPLEGH